MSKKSSKAASKEVSSYEERDIVLGKVRGYPPWPGMVVNPDTVPDNVAKERPSKRPNFYCVRFFPTGDFAWLLAKDISKLQKHEIESYINEPFKRSGELLQGYKVALDPTKWEEELATGAQASQDNDEEPDEVDELDEDGEPSKKATKKRKRSSDTGSKAKKQSKAKTVSAEGAKTKSRKATSKEIVESEDEADGDAEGEEAEGVAVKKASPPPAKRVKRDKEDEGEDLNLSGDPEAVKVREWRHKLQKAFLGKAVPELSEMPGLDQLFRTVETYEHMTIQYLQFSKIGKVMRHITVLPDENIPRDEEFKFKERAKGLVERWHSILNSNKTNGTQSATPAAPTAAPTSTTNGTAEKVAVQPVAPASADVNGTTASAPEEPQGISDADADGVGDTSLLADITMSET